MADAPNVVQYLDTMARLRASMGDGPKGFHYQSFESFVRAEGRAFPVAADQTTPRSVRVHPKGCFDNAYRLAKRFPKKYRYVEGMACGVIPVHHAWVINAAGDVIDPTWAAYSTLGTEYFGVVIPVPIAAAVVSRENTSVLQNWQRQYPLFREAWATVVARGTV